MYEYTNKTRIGKIGLISLIGLMGFMATPVFAAGKTEAVGPDAMGGMSGIVVTNPLYGVKNTFSDFTNWLFAGSPLSKAQRQFIALDDKASEILTLQKIAPANTDAITRSLTEYERSSVLTISALDRLNASDLSGQAWRPFANELAIHLKFVDDLKDQQLSNQDEAVLVDVSDRLDSGLLKLLKRAGAIDDFIQDTITAGSNVAEGFADLRSAELLKELSEAAQNTDAHAAQAFDKGAQALYGDVSTRLWEAQADNDDSLKIELQEVSGAPATRTTSLQILHQLQPNLSL